MAVLAETLDASLTQDIGAVCGPGLMARPLAPLSRGLVSQTLDHLVSHTIGGVGSAGLDVQLLAPLCLALPRTSLNDSGPPFTSANDVISDIVVAMLPNRELRFGATAISSSKLWRRERGHCENDIWRMRAGAAVTTRDVRKGRLAKIMLRLDSAVVQWR
jgi:hypothetical protein